MSAFGGLNTYLGSGFASEPRGPSRATRGVQSNMIAAGFQQGDPRATVAQYDRGGVSRGAGAQYLGGVTSGNAVAQGRVDAANVGSDDYVSSRNRRFQDYNQNLAYADAMRAQSLRDQSQYNQFALGNMGRALQRQQMYDDDRLGFLRSAGGALMGLMR